MKSKLIYPTLTILFIACSQPKSNSSDSEKKIPFDNKKTSNRITGKWTISSIITRSSDSEGEAKCNSCPTITFDNASVATIEFPGNSNETLSWRINGDTIILKNINRKSDSAYIPDNNYLMLFSKQEKHTELRLDKDSGLVYVLGQ